MGVENGRVKMASIIHRDENNELEEMLGRMALT